MKTRTRLSAVATVACGMVLASCTDNGITYQPETVVEACLFVGEPIRDIRIYLTKRITAPIDGAPAVIDYASVLLKTDAGTIPLIYMHDATGGRYQAMDTSLRVLAHTRYELEVRIGDATIRGTTTTPGITNWTGVTKDTVRYPDSTALQWSTEGSMGRWLVSYECTDTTQGRMGYETPASPSATQVVNVASNGIQPQWSAMPWKGRYVVTVLAPDENLFQWYTAIGLGGPYYNKAHSSVTGAIGVFGSASRTTRMLTLL